MSRIALHIDPLQSPFDALKGIRNHRLIVSQKGSFLVEYVESHGTCFFLAAAIDRFHPLLQKAAFQDLRHVLHIARVFERTADRFLRKLSCFLAGMTESGLQVVVGTPSELSEDSAQDYLDSQFVEGLLEIMTQMKAIRPDIVRGIPVHRFLQRMPCKGLAKKHRMFYGLSEVRGLLKQFQSFIGPKLSATFPTSQKVVFLGA